MATLYKIYDLPEKAGIETTDWIEIQGDNNGFSFKISAGLLSFANHDHSASYSLLTHNHISASITDATENAVANTIVKRSSGGGSNFVWLTATNTLTAKSIYATSGTYSWIFATSASFNNIYVSSTIIGTNFNCSTGTINRISTTTISAVTLSSTNITASTSTFNKINTNLASLGTISINNDIRIDAGWNGAGAGGRIDWKLPATSSLSNSLQTAIIDNSFRFRESGGTFRGAFLDIASCGDNASSQIWTSSNTLTGNANFTTVTVSTLTTSTISVGSQKVVLQSELAPFVKTNEVNEFSRTNYFGLATLSIVSGSISWNTDIAQSAFVTLTSTCTLNNPINPKSGATYIIAVKQNPSGSPFQLNFGPAYLWPSGAVPSISGVLGSMNLYTFFCVGSTFYGASTQNYF